MYDSYVAGGMIVSLSWWGYNYVPTSFEFDLRGPLMSSQRSDGRYISYEGGGMDIYIHAYGWWSFWWTLQVPSVWSSFAA